MATQAKPENQIQTSQSLVQTQGMAPQKEHSVEHLTFYRTHSPFRTLQKLASPTTVTGGRPRGYRARRGSTWRNCSQ